MTSSIQQQSILSAIPKDVSNIIKEFSLESREIVPIRLKYCINDWIIIPYKDGYKIDRVVNMKTFNKRFDYASYSLEQKAEKLAMFEKRNTKHYPVYIDDKDDVIEYMYSYFYSDYDPTLEEEDDGYDEPPYVHISIGGSKTCLDIKKFQEKMNMYMDLLGKVYKKI